MSKNKRKIISVVLCLALMVCALWMIPTNAGAASGDVIYARLNNGWSQVYCYMWNSDSDKNAAWPGVKMTATSESGVYTYTLPKDFQNIIFNNGQGGGTNQTTDLVYTGNGGNGKIYDLKSGSWSDYSGGGTPSNPTDPTTPTTPITPTTPPSGGITVYLKNSAGWSSPKCYMWNGSGGAGNQNNAWPGLAMTSMGDDVWMYHSSTVYANCIFNGSGGQTNDLTATDGYIYDNKTKSWDVYDTSALRVVSYTADPATNIYKGMEVTLTANASGGDGNIRYQFSVNGNVIRAFGTGNKTTWTPTAAGTYTVTFDFKDGAGNTNQRTLTLTVADDSAVTSPIIKKVTPADEGYVKTGQTATISVTAGGGKTGTNLLFYKYVIEDPSGEKNTAYYTLNSTYNFVPTKAGAYKVTVHVQASDNSEASKSFVVNATGGEIPTDPTEPTDPTQPETQPATQPETQPATGTDYSQYARGDVNMDGVVDIKDATYLQKYLAEYAGYDVPKELGDVNKDGRVTVKDVSEIQIIVAQSYI